MREDVRYRGGSGMFNILMSEMVGVRYLAFYIFRLSVRIKFHIPYNDIHK